MPKLNKKAFILFISFLFIAAPLSSAYVDLRIQDIRCLNNAAFAFKIVNNHEDDISTKDVKVYISAVGFGAKNTEVAAPIDSKYELLSSGKWDDEKIQGVSPYKKFTSSYKSEENLLSYPATYRIRLKYNGCLPTSCRTTSASCSLPPENNCETSNIKECPGLRKFGCESFELKVLECKNAGDELILKFSGLDKGLFRNVDPLKEVDYTFFGTVAHIENDLPEDTVITEVSPDIYTLKFRLANNNFIERVAIKDKFICNHIVYANCKSGEPRAQEDKVNEQVESRKQPAESKEVTEPQEQEESTVESGEKNYLNEYLIYVILIVLAVIIFSVFWKNRKQSAKKHCRHCGERLTKADIFCPECGKRS